MKPRRQQSKSDLKRCAYDTHIHIVRTIGTQVPGGRLAGGVAQFVEQRVQQSQCVLLVHLGSVCVCMCVVYSAGNVLCNVSI